MTLKKLQFKPGINRETTSYANEGGWYAANKIRFRSGQPEKIGGWVSEQSTVANEINGVATTLSTPPTGYLWGVVRSIWNWTTLAGYNLLAAGSQLKYYIQSGYGGNFYDVTPLRKTTVAGTTTFTAAYNTLSAGVSPTEVSLPLVSAANFPTIGGVVLIGTEQILYAGIVSNMLVGCTRGYNGTTAQTHAISAGVGSYTMVVNNVGHGAQTNDFVVFSGATSLGGNMTAAILNREYQITYLTANTYTITAIAAASSGDTLDGGVGVVAKYQITTGGDTYTTGVGWGAGGWGGVNTGYASTGWGDAAPAGLGVGLQMRIWSQSNFGENLLFNPRGAAMYYWDTNANPVIYDRGVVIQAGMPISVSNGVTISTVTPDSSCPSAVNFVLVSDASRFVIAFGCNDPTGVIATTTLDPMQVRWSDQESFATWYPQITNQAGSYRLSHGSQIVTAIQTRQEILVLTDSSIYSMQYLGPPYVWGFQILGDNISIAGPNAIATANNLTYWMGLDKFYVYTGRVQTLPCTLRQYVFSNINLDQLYQVFSGTNEGYNEVWWHYCSAGSTVVDRYVIYNHLDDVWYYGDWNNSNGVAHGRTAWLDSATRTYPMAMTYGVAGGNANAVLVYHENSTDDATVNPPLPIDAFVESSDFDIDDGNSFGFVWRIIPDISFDNSEVNAPYANMTLRPRNFPGNAFRRSNDPEVTSTQDFQNQRTYAVQHYTQQLYVRARGRQLALKISSDALGVQWQLGVPRLDVRADGQK